MASQLRASSLKSPVDVAEYLFRRLHQVGIRAVHGVPGDYNLVALDYVDKAGLYWVGNCNELNAAYAADGYARVKGMGAVVTTFGVGELSAINGIAGAFSEYVPLVHIVGTPSTLSQKSGQLLHHTLGNGNFNAFSEMNKDITVALMHLTDPEDIASQIDHAIRECYIQSRPVYITLPTDMVQAKVDGERLATPIDLKFPQNETEKEDYVVETVLKYLHAAKSPVILVDACAIRHHARQETHDFIEASGLPVFVAPMGKGGVDESMPNYCGVYGGSGSQEDVKLRVESSDLVLSIGTIKSDFNTSGFTYRVSQLNSIDFHSSYIQVRYSHYPGVRMNGVLSKVTAKMGKLNIVPGPKITNDILEADRDIAKNPTIEHSWLWPRFGQWLREGDIVVTETGTANFGIWYSRFPKDTIAINQVLWGSIGYATPAAQGAALAAKELGNRRTILVTGDGSIQLTAQEIGTMIRHKLKPVLFVICNDGYTIERFIHGMDASYNDVQPWHYKDLLDVFGAEAHEMRKYQVKTKQDVERLFGDKEFSAANCIQLVELYMPKDDAPKVLKMIGQAAAENNARA